LEIWRKKLTEKKRMRWKPEDGLSNLERSLLDAAKNHYMDQLRIDAVDKNTGQRYLLTTLKEGAAQNYPTYRFSLYKCTERGHEPVESYKVQGGHMTRIK
jgi:hypothetical protein